MHAGALGPRAGVGLVAATGTAGAAVAAWLAWTVGGSSARALAAPGPAGLEDALVAACALAVAVLLVRCAGGLAVVVAAALLRSAGRPAPQVERAGAALLPLPLRRLLVSVAGAGVIGAAVLPGGALAAGRAATAAVQSAPLAGSDGDAGGTGGTRGAVPVDPSWPREGSTEAARGQAPTAAPPAGDEVVVRRGDTLWDITERSLGPGATAGSVAEGWPAWWSANREVIGANPHLILPGQRLHPPQERS